MGTTSATRRQSYAWSVDLPNLARQLFSTVVPRRDLPVTRPALLLFAAILSVAGCVAPHLDGLTISALLLLLSSLALLGATRTHKEQTAKDNPARLANGALSASHSSGSNAQAPQTLQELLFARDAAAPSDLAHWHRLTHRMSHELRTPLNAVLGFSELMSSEVFGPLGSQQYADYARNINASGRRLLKSAEDALAITNLLTGLNTRVRNPVACVAAALAEMSAFHAEPLALTHYETAAAVPADCRIVGEAQTLRQILINLMGEALDHAGDDTRIDAACTCRAGEIDIVLALTGPGAERAGSDGSFAVMLATTLARLSDGRLTSRHAKGSWTVTLTFPRALQKDFFNTDA